MKPVELVILIRDKTRQGIQSASAGVDGLSADYEELVRAIRASEAEMQRSGQAAVRTASDYNQLQSILLKIGGTAALAQLGKEIINVRAEMEMMEKSFGVLTGSEEAAAAMLKELKDVAVKSPLSLTDITQGAQMLMGFNVAADETVDIIKQISDISMGDGQKFQSLLLAFSQMSSLGRVVSNDLRQMATAGFNPLVEIARTTGKTIQEVTQKMEDGAISVDLIKAAFASATAEGGKYYQMTEKQAEGLAGLKASLDDAWISRLNEIGEKQQDIITGGYKLSIAMLQNYETIGKVVLSLIATYGTYKTAVILATVAEKGWTVAQLTHYNALLLVEKAQKLLNKTMLSNPYVLVATTVIGLATAVWALRDNTSAAAEAQQRLKDQLDGVKKKKDELIGQSGELINVINDETQAIYNQEKAWEDLKKSMPEVFGKMDIKEFKSLSSTDQKRLVNNEAARREIEEITALYENQKNIVAELEQKISKAENSANSRSVLGKSNIKKLNEEYEAEKNNLTKLQEQIDVINKAKEKENTPPIFSNVKTEVEKAISNVDALKQKLADLRSGKIQSTNYEKDIEDTTTALDKAEKKLASLTGKDKKTISKEESAAEKAKRQAQEQADANQKLIKNEAKAALDRLQIDYDLQQKLLDIEKDGFDKRLEQLSLDYRKELLAIDKHERELIEKQQEIEKNQWEKDGKKGVFTPRTTHKNQLPQEQQDELDNQSKIASKTYEAATKQLLKDQLEPYRTFAQQRLDIEKQYQGDIASLRKSGASEENIQVAEQAQADALAALDEEMAQKEETFKSLMMSIGHMSLQQLEKALKDAEKALKESEATGGKDSKQTGILRAKIKKLQEEIKAVKAEEETKNSDPAEKWKRTSKALKDCKKEVDGIIDSMDFLDESTKNALKAASNVAGGAIAMIDGIQKLSLMAGQSISAVEKASVILAIVGAAVQIVTAIFNMASAAENRHQEALKEVAENKLAFQRQYNLMLLEQNLLLKEATSIFGEKQIEKAANALKVYQDALSQFNRELKGNAPTKLQGWLGDLTAGIYKKQMEAYEQGIGALKQITVKTGHEKTGLFGWGKGRDIYSSILDVYGKDKLLNPDGSLNIDFAQTILDTQTLSDENRELLQSLIDLQDKANEAQEALRDYLQETFGVLGNDLMDSIVSSIQDKGVDAWEAFGDAGAKVIENLGKQLAYELFFADKFAKLQKDLEAVYGETSDPNEIARRQMDIVGKFYETIGNDMDAAKAFMENWQKEAEKYGFDLWQSESDGASQSGKAGAFTTMTQDQGTKLEGLFTSVQNHTASMDDKMTDMSAVMYNSMDCLLRIEENTSYCKRLEDIYSSIVQIIRDGLKMK